MRYVVIRAVGLICTVCKEPLKVGEIAIQSLGWGGFYHTDCHTERFGFSEWHRPYMTDTVERAMKKKEMENKEPTPTVPPQKNIEKYKGY